MLPAKIELTKVCSCSFNLIEADDLAKDVMTDLIAAHVEDRNGGMVPGMQVRVAYGPVHGPNHMQVMIYGEGGILADLALDRLTGTAKGYASAKLESLIITLTPKPREEVLEA